jgi:glycosyltransferase 2 family protein
LSEARGLPAHWVRRVVLGALAAVALYALFAALSDGRAFLAALSGFAWWTAPAAVAMVSAGYLFRAARWRAYLRAVAVDVPPGEATLTFLSGFAMGVTPGKMGEVVKAWFLRESRGAPYSATVPAVVAERVSDMAAVALLLGLGLALSPVRIGVGLGVATLAAVAVGLVLLRSRRVAAWLLALLARVPGVRRATPHLAEMHGNLRPLLTGRLLALSTALALASWALEATAMWTLARGFGLPLAWGACAFVFALTLIAGVASLLPGGLGVTEGGMVVLLGLLGVAPGPATALTLATRLCSLWWGVLVGLVAVGVLQARARRSAP